MSDKIIEPINGTFDEVSKAIIQKREEKEISSKPRSIKVLAPKVHQKEISSRQTELALEVERDINGIGMGVLSDGTPYLNQRGLASLCGVQNSHIGSISSQWDEKPSKPRIAKIKKILEETGADFLRAHIEVNHKGTTHYCYPAPICLAILEYYAFDAGSNALSDTARKNYRILAGSKLKDLIYSQTGYDPTGKDRFKKWHERISLNFQSAPRGYFNIFNEAHTIIYELIMSGAKIGEKMVPDISIGGRWATHWKEEQLEKRFGQAETFPHRYPKDHPQSKSNPQTAKCYPLSALPYYREWLEDIYIGKGQFQTYVSNSLRKGLISTSVAQLVIETIQNKQVR